MQRKKTNGFVKLPYSVIDKYDGKDELLAWIWLARTRDYTTDIITKSVRQLAYRYGWGMGRAHRFIGTLNGTPSGTPKRRPAKGLPYATGTPSGTSSGTLARAVVVVVQEGTKNKTPIVPLNENHDLPDWIDKTLWADYIEHRRQLKKPLTEIAAKRAISRLERLRADGNNPSKIILVSMENGWIGLFATGETKDDATANTKQKPYSWVNEIGKPRDNPKVDENANNDIQDDRRSTSR